LNIPKGYAEHVNRRTDNTIKTQQGQTLIYKALHRRLTIEQLKIKIKIKIKN